MGSTEGNGPSLEPKFYVENFPIENFPIRDVKGLMSEVRREWDILNQGTESDPLSVDRFPAHPLRNPE